MVEMYRQGDLLFIRADEIPKGASKRRNNIILEGEATGHAHRVKSGGILYNFVKWDGIMREHELYLDVIEPQIEIIHEEHKTIVLNKGVFKIIRQREFGKDGDKLVAD